LSDKEIINNSKKNEDNEPIRVIVAGLDYGNRRNFEHSLEEMENLVEACDMEAVAIVSQNLPHPDSGTYMGKGKIEEIRNLVEGLDAEYVVFEDNLSPAQLKNLQRLLDIPVWDRTTLILEIFSRRAQTIEARLQVESAYLQYMLPRLTGMWQHLGRQGGGSGSRSNRGIGETQIELDRRQINQRITELKRELEKIEKTRKVQRSGRTKDGLPTAALVGYTNAGKSTIMNAMLTDNGVAENKKVLQKDMLFATLDTSIRHIEMEDNKNFLLSDTVGFIENLPHGLVKAFRSTLEEAATADLLVIVLDASDPYHDEHKRVTEETLKELGADELPRIFVMNKADMMEDREFDIPSIREDIIWICAYEGIGIDELKDMITERLYGSNKTIECLVPYSRGDILDLLHRKANVISEEYVPEGTKIIADCSPKIAGIIESFIWTT